MYIYRCNLYGFDLNRNWLHPCPVLHASLYYTKRLATLFTAQREVGLPRL